ncbi:MAG: vitamin B12 dependent-methionine synthase activation domain-containing protein [Anaerolineales bacterium]
MKVLDKWDLRLDVDVVLRSQGADPAAIRKRSPRLVDSAEKALEEGRLLLQPRVIVRRLLVKDLHHEWVKLEGDGRLSGGLLAQHMGGAQEAVIVLCTVGEALERRAERVSKEDAVYGLALDGVGSAGVEALANAACALFEEEATKEDYQVTIPLSPGMVGWPVEQGQPQIFDLLDADEIGVRLTESMMMVPRKSLTFVLGIGKELIAGGRTCDYCSLKETCRYRDHYD